MAYFKIFTIALLLTLISCKAKDKIVDCDEVSMQCYRGYPRACNELKNFCVKKTINYTATHCQNAFNDLILGQKMGQVKATYGDKIVGCFNKKEIEKYSD